MSTEENPHPTAVFPTDRERTPFEDLACAELVRRTSLWSRDEIRSVKEALARELAHCLEPDVASHPSVRRRGMSWAPERRRVRGSSRHDRFARIGLTRCCRRPARLYARCPGKA